MKTYAYGFPRLGKNREYKKALESFWAKKTRACDFQGVLAGLENKRRELYRGMDAAPSGEISLYDPVADAAFMFGILGWKDEETYYSFCRGADALPMTKYFNTNYHYLRPSVDRADFRFAWDKYAWLGIDHPVILSVVGPFTLLKLSNLNCPLSDCVAPLAGAYAELFARYPDTIFHVEEPAFVLDLDPDEVAAALGIYSLLDAFLSRIILMTYYDSVESPDLLKLGFWAWGLDFVHGIHNLNYISHLNPSSILIAGLVDGRNVFKKNDRLIAATLARIASAVKNEIWVSNAAPLSHLPYSVRNETNSDIIAGFSFALEKLAEIALLKNLDPHAQDASGQHVQEKYRLPESGRLPYRERKINQARLRLPLFPTTTIGSFPQSEDVRMMRSRYRKGTLGGQEYDSFIRGRIDEVIRYQEEKGLDVLVHGEFERTDMVEFFAEKLDGILTTENGWVISYGSRVYRPPIITDDVKRPQAMTIDEITYAQSRTRKPVKGMLTGPVTIIAWSFVTPHVPIEKIAFEIATALNQEVQDYIRAGIKVIQIDEPAFREKAPVKKRDWPAYFDWAVKSFKIASFCPPEIQIHTHMCYSAFDEIIDEIVSLDADVISIEASRSQGEIIKAFESRTYERGIGLGVWDIHSPRTPSLAGMRDVVERSLKRIPKENFWINPDCGLKTRKWDEIETPLARVVLLAQELRREKV